ncbi:MAG: type II secretion system protein [Victivallaceae bacterium]|jgi:type II secretory pathway pseudopilin PulG
MKEGRTDTVIQYRFSLVEILVAVGIIAILLGLSGAGYQAVQRKIARTKTEATLNKLRIGLESYKSKFGYYPQQPAIAPFLLDINAPTVPQGQPQNNFNSCIEYSKISKEDSVMVSGRYRVIDGWKTNVWSPAPALGTTYVDQGGPYIYYVCPGLLNTSSYDLFSAGNDRKFIWRDLSPLPFTDMNNAVNADNIWPQGLKTQ